MQCRSAGKTGMCSIYSRNADSCCYPGWDCDLSWMVMSLGTHCLYTTYLYTPYSNYIILEVNITTSIRAPQTRASYLKIRPIDLIIEAPRLAPNHQRRILFAVRASSGGSLVYRLGNTFSWLLRRWIHERLIFNTHNAGAGPATSYIMGRFCDSPSYHPYRDNPHHPPLINMPPRALALTLTLTHSKAKRPLLSMLSTEDGRRPAQHRLRALSRTAHQSIHLPSPTPSPSPLTHTGSATKQPPTAPNAAATAVPAQATDAHSASKTSVRPSNAGTSRAALNRPRHHRHSARSPTPPPSP